MRAPVDCIPLSAVLPDHEPEAVQLVAFVVLQVSVELLPLVTEVGFAVRETVGGCGAAVTLTVTLFDALPPAPVQLSV